MPFPPRSTPLIDAIARRLTTLGDRLCVPGHQGQAIDPTLAAAWGAGVWQWDLTELAGLDNLAAPAGAIAEAQAAAAQAFGAGHTWFLINGSTGGIVAALLAVAGEGEEVILARNVHQSAIAGLILSGARPVWLQPEIDPDWGWAGPVQPAALAAAIAQHPQAKAVFVVSPTYQGQTSPIAELAAIAHAHGLPLIVDEAHGAHFAFHPAFPTPALAAGADVVIQSAHKTLGALTQAALLHLSPHPRMENGEWKMENGKCRILNSQFSILNSQLAAALRLVQSSSPSYLLLASLDGARAWAEGETGPKGGWSGAIARAESLGDRLGQIPGLRQYDPGRTSPPVATAPPPRPSLDPLRRTIALAGWSGYALEDWLDTRWGIAAELADDQNLTFILTPQTSAATIDRLVTALTQASTLAPPARSEQSPADSGIDRGLLRQATATGEFVCTPRQAARAAHQVVPLAAAAGQVAATTIAPYPPGIPLWVPGERIGAEAIDQMRRVLAAGGEVVGLEEVEGEWGVAIVS